MPDRYRITEDPEGWTVVDAWTGRVAAINEQPMSGIAHVDASMLAETLNLLAPPADG